MQFSEACERNKNPILEKLLIEFVRVRSVLEIGSGTAQHAVFFSKHLPHLTWHTSDLAENHPAITERIKLEGSGNVEKPIALDVEVKPWPVKSVDGVFTANTLHIISWPQLNHFFNGVGDVLENSGVLCVYGPFKYKGDFTTPSNAEFDLWLKQRDPLSGIRDFENVNKLAKEQGLTLKTDYAMPANNQLLVWRKS